MSSKKVNRVLFLAPESNEPGVSALALGLVRALQRDGVDAGFVKPVGDIDAKADESDTSVLFARDLLGVASPSAIPAAKAETMMRSGDTLTLLEDIVALVEEAQGSHPVVVVEGLPLSQDHPLAAELNVAIAKTLAADVIAVVSGHVTATHATSDAVADAAHRYGGARGLAGVIVAPAPEELDADRLKSTLNSAGTTAPIIAIVPEDLELSVPRLSDVVHDLALQVKHPGNMDEVRVLDIVVASRSPERLVERIQPGTLVVTAGDRSDLILTTALASMSGVPVAGLLLTCDMPMAAPIEKFLGPRLGTLPLMETELHTFDIANRLAGLDRRVRADDKARMEGLVKQAAGCIDTTALIDKGASSALRGMSPPMFRHRLLQEARAANRRIVLPEGDEPRTLRAAAICTERRIARCVLLGEKDHIHSVAASHGITLPESIEILDPNALRQRYVAPMVALRKSKGLTPEQADEQLKDTVVLGTMMLAQGDVDGLVSGAVHTTASTVRPALQLIKTAPGSSIVSSVFFMLMPDQVLVYGDCAINPDPTAEELAEIAVQSAGTAVAFGIDPKVAMISYSTGNSGTGADVDKVRRAVEIVKAEKPDLAVDGPIQYDAAIVEAVGLQKAPGSPVAGRANCFVFPDLNTGNTTYKAVQRSANVVSVGPILQGLRKPVNDLSRGALVDDIVYTIALTAIQAAAQPPAAEAAPQMAGAA